MAEITIKMKVKLAWWTKAYLWGCVAFAKTFNMKPDIDKITEVALKGATVVDCERDRDDTRDIQKD